LGNLRRFSSAHVGASAGFSPGSSTCKIAALAFRFRFFAAIREVTRCPSRPHAQTGVAAWRAIRKQGRRRILNGGVFVLLCLSWKWSEPQSELYYNSAGDHSRRKTRKYNTPVENVSILRRHLVDRVAVSDLCDKYQLQPILFYNRQKQFFENGAAAFECKNATPEPNISESKRRSATSSSARTKSSPNSWKNRFNHKEFGKLRRKPGFPATSAT
jgi:hypothetical protein